MSSGGSCTGTFYTIEHLVELVPDLFIFGSTRYVDDRWFFRCMCGRIRAIKDLIYYYYFRTKLDNSWDQEEWKRFAIEHNNDIDFIGHCSTYEEMRNLNPKEFNQERYSSNKYKQYMIPLVLKPTEDQLKKWLLYY